MNHELAFDLLPWLANGTLEGDEHDRVERHVRGCVTCRGELKEQRALHVLVREHPTVHLSAEQSFEQMQRKWGHSSFPPSLPRHDTRDNNREEKPEENMAGPRFMPRRRWFRAPGRAAAAAAVACAAVGGAAWLGWTSYEDNAPRYESLATDARASGVHLDIIFSAGTTEEQMRALLAEADGTIVGGPSSLGRYTVRLDSTELTESDVDELVRSLQLDERIRFAGPAFIAEDAE